MYLPVFLFLVRTAENRTLCRARALSKREAFVARGRGRRQPAEAGAANTRILRAKLQPNIDAMFIEFQLASPSINGSPVPRRIELYAGRGRKENASVTQSGTRFPNDCPGGNRIPESKLGMGYIFRMTPQVEAATRNRAVEWDMLSPWQPRWKAHPGIAPQNGTRFPPAAPSTPKPMRPPSQNWVEESQNAIAGGQYDCRR